MTFVKEMNYKFGKDAEKRELLYSIFLVGTKISVAIMENYGFPKTIKN
jgi:hypothetical protein